MMAPAIEGGMPMKRAVLSTLGILAVGAPDAKAEGKTQRQDERCAREATGKEAIDSLCPLNMDPVTVTLQCERGDAFTFSPKLFQFDVSKSVPWEPHTVAGLDLPLLQFTNGGPRILSLKFRLESQADVGPLARGLSNASVVSPDLHRPMVCVLSLGTFTFKGVITELDFSYGEIDSSGARHRVDVSLSMSNFVPAEEQLRGGQAE
jgi:hypothetical protein